MGLTESKCVNLASSARYLEDSYTVIRTGGESQEGWSISVKAHWCGNSDPHCWRPGAHANLGAEGWRVFMRLGDADHEEHACGWRRLGTFWPTRLTGDEAAITAWREELKKDLERLAEEQGLPSEWSEHTCSLGAPKDYCSACTAHARAQEKMQARLAAQRPPTPPPQEPGFIVLPESMPLEKELARLGATPYHPDYAPLESTEKTE